jgi:hypothetical protein
VGDKAIAIRSLPEGGTGRGRRAKKAQNSL